MCLHKYEHIGWVHAWRWLGGVSGGITTPTIINAKQCKKCGKVKEVA